MLHSKMLNPPNFVQRLGDAHGNTISTVEHILSALIWFRH